MIGACAGFGCRLSSVSSVCLQSASAPALGSTSTAQLWTALGGNVVCGIAIHPLNTPPMQLLCSARSVPAPKTGGFGDPGFVFLGSVGRPSLARLSQNSFVGTHQVALGSGRKWGGIGPIEVTCTIGAARSAASTARATASRSRAAPTARSEAARPLFVREARPHGTSPFDRARRCDAGECTNCSCWAQPAHFFFLCLPETQVWNVRTSS